jgi:hypothetical protein
MSQSGSPTAGPPLPSPNCKTPYITVGVLRRFLSASVNQVRNIALINIQNDTKRRKSRERHSMDWTFPYKNNWKKMMKKRRKRLKIT